MGTWWDGTRGYIIYRGYKIHCIVMNLLRMPCEVMLMEADPVAVLLLAIH